MAVIEQQPVEPGAVYRDPAAAIEDRVGDLLRRMTLEEKVAQLGSAWVHEVADGAELVEEHASTVLADGIGQITRISGASFLRAGEAAALANAIQRHLRERTRLGIPAIVHEEICSGLMARDAVAFPQAIGVASTWRPELNERLATEVRRQMRAIGATQGLSPVLDVARDPRWGRTEETYGEDPLLVSAMGVAFVRGLQGDRLTEGVIATAKHFVGYGLSEGGLNWAPVRIGERELRDVYLRPFEAAVKLAGLRSVMNGYHELDGIPCAANPELFQTVLRDGWGFDGIVVSDYFAVRHLESVHHVVHDAAGAASVALTTGIDVELPRTDCYGEPLLAAARAGDLDVAVLDRAVERVLRLKFELGLFDEPYVDVDAVAAVTRTTAQRDLAHEIAVDSLVLLSNDGTLPIAPDVTSIAVIGPNADSGRNLLGDYSYAAHAESLRELLASGGGSGVSPGDAAGDLDFESPDHVGTIVAELRRHFAGRVEIAHVRGCDVNSDDRSGFAAAVSAAEAADLVVLVAGDRSGLTTESTSGESRDVASLDLPGVQEDLVLAVAATGTPVVLVGVSGRPCGSPAVDAAAAAVLLAWLPGEAGARAITEVLSGSAAPGGRLPITYPRSSGQVPRYYGHKPSGGRSNWKGDYVDLPVAPLYPFGHGLTYTTFATSVSSPAAGVVTADGSVSVVAEVVNTGGRAGDDVVQLYARVPVASVTRPVLELVSFARVSLRPSESRTVAFEVPAAQLGFHDRELEYVLEDGDVELLVGSSSDDLVPAGAVRLSGGRPAERAFHGTVIVG